MKHKHEINMNLDPDRPYGLSDCKLLLEATSLFLFTSQVWYEAFNMGSEIDLEVFLDRRFNEIVGLLPADLVKRSQIMRQEIQDKLDEDEGGQK